MKRKLGLTLALACVLSCGSLVSCGGGDVSGQEKNVSERVLAAVRDAETLSHDELFAKAAEELGTSGQVKILATTSRGKKAKDMFIAELQKHNANITDPLVYDTTVDGQIYTTLQGEISSGKTDGYSGMITQDGYQLQTKGIDTGYYANFIPKKWADAVGETVKNDVGNPFTLQYNFKTWMVNNTGDFVMDNVWDVTHSSMKGRIDTMNPNNENVNMDWLIQLTDETQNAALKAAYEDETATTDVNLDDYSSYGDLKYAYAFIDKFLTNAVFYEDDGKAMTHVAQTAGQVGWIVYSKILKVEETEAISKRNITIAALGDENDGSGLTKSNVKGFGGFMYKHYLQLMPNAQFPYATCAFFELISTEAAAYKAWATDVGDYPTMASINIDRTKGGNGSIVDGAFVQADDGETIFPCLNDPTADWWINTAGAVVETPSFIGSHYDNVIDFIDASIAAKAK